MNSLLKLNIDAILLSIILNSNVFRFFGGDKSDKAMYLVYVLCFVFLFKEHKLDFFSFLKKQKDFQLLYMSSSLLILYSLVSCLWNYSFDTLFQFGKFFLTFLIFIFIPVLSKQLVYKVIVFSLLLNLLYCSIILLQPDRVVAYLGSGANYLNATLTIGFSFTLSLVLFMYSFIRGKMLLLFFSMISAPLFLISLFQFTARGVLLFPPLISFALLPFVGKINKFRAIILVGIFVGVIIYVVDYFLSNESYAVTRMLNLFEKTEEEDRMEIWSNCSSLIINNGWFLLGGGIDAFKKTLEVYPHNIFIQVIGEYGVLGIMWVFYMFLISWRAIKNLLLLDYERKNAITYGVLGSFIYYVLNFSKSFQLYEILPLLIFFSFLVIISEKYSFATFNKVIDSTK